MAGVFSSLNSKRLDSLDFFWFVFFVFLRSLRDTLTQNKVPLHNHVYFNLQSNEYIKPFQSITLETSEIMNGTEIFQAVLSDLAHKLNSGEAFNPSSTFQADLTI